MKVKDLEKLIQKSKETYGEEFSEFKICIECVNGYDLEQKRKPDSGWVIHKDSEDWEWIEVNDEGAVGMVDTEKKLFGINANW